MRTVRKAIGGQGGFTLIEIVVVIAIIGLLIAIALPSFLGARQRAFSVEARQIGSEWKSLSFACLVEKNFNTTKCDTSLEVGWAPPADSAVWLFTSGSSIACVDAADADTATTAATITCTNGPAGATEWLRLSVTGTGEMAGKTYRLVVGAGTTVRGKAGDLITP